MPELLNARILKFMYADNKTLTFDITIQWQANVKGSMKLCFVINWFSCLCELNNNELSRIN